MSDALDRLDAFYNAGDFDPGDNPGGMAAGGHRENYVPSLRDHAAVSRETVAAAKEVAQLADDLRAATVTGGGLVLASPTDTAAGSLASKVKAEGLELTIENVGGNERLVLTAQPNVGAVLYLAQTCNAF